MLEEISTIVKTCDNVSAVKCLCLCLYWGAEYWTCCIAQCEIDWIFAMQGRLMQSSQIDWKASPSKLVVPWCFIAGFLPSSFAYIGDVPIKPGRKPGLWTNCRFHLKSRAFPRWMHHAFPRECPYPHEVWTLCSSEIKSMISFFNNVSVLILWLLTCGNDNVQIRSSKSLCSDCCLVAFRSWRPDWPIGHIWESYDPGRLGQ